MTFRIGQKVVCIKSDEWRGGAFGDEHFPCFGKIYTIRTLESDADNSWVQLVEIINPVHDYHGNGSLTEACFLSSRFRPAVSRKTDISIFTAMLIPEGVEA